MQKQKLRVNEDFFKFWSSDMSYVLGYFTADGCIGVSKNRAQPFTFSITSVDYGHLKIIKEVMNSQHAISLKYNSSGNKAFQLQIRNGILAQDLMSLGIFPRKTYDLQPISVPHLYFADFLRGFFDGDGSVYTYLVNSILQIKASFVGVSYPFLSWVNREICTALKIPTKSLHVYTQQSRAPRYSVDFYIEDCAKLYELMYKGGSRFLFLKRKKDVFDRWHSLQRRPFIKRDYPSKIGWHLNTKKPLR